MLDFVLWSFTIASRRRHLKSYAGCFRSWRFVSFPVAAVRRRVQAIGASMLPKDQPINESWLDGSQDFAIITGGVSLPLWHGNHRSGL